MGYLFLAVLLFGLLTPISKLIFSTGVSIFIFSLLYIGFRAIVGIPCAIFLGKKKIYKRDMLIFVGLGLVGAIVQVTEFMAVYEGIPVSTVSFLIFTLPLWSVVWGRVINNEQITLMGITRVILVLAGAFTICLNALSLKFEISMLIWPMLSGLLLSLWISISKVLKQKGYSSFTINGVYDGVSLAFLMLVVLVFIKKSELINEINWIFNWSHFISMAMYSLVLGFLANMLLYRATKEVSAMRIGVTMSLEPIIATLVAVCIFNEKVTPLFIIGAIFIFVANLPEELVGLVTRREKGGIYGEDVGNEYSYKTRDHIRDN